MKKTIAAISSPIGAGGIGIVRVSGEDALRIADTIFNFDKEGDWVPLHMHLGQFCARDFKDKGYAVYFPAKQAYTGEDTVEFYLHGGVRIMKGALETLLENGATMAGKGEFTKRAFLAGRLTLADAEGVIDMINAESAAGIRAAYNLMQGELSKRTDAVLNRLEGIIAGLEATLDYPDEMEDETLPPLPRELGEIAAEIDKILSSSRRGKIARYGITAALAGAPNAGKSSLLNAMLGQNRAIVSSQAGTTRDTVEVSLEYDGVKINLIDTAGLRELCGDGIEREGIERAKRAAQEADVVLHVVDRTSPTPDDLEFEGKLTYTVYNKCDLGGFGVPRMAYTFAVSAKTGEGVDELLGAIASLYKESGGESGELIVNERHISALYHAKQALKSAITSLDGTIDCTLIDLREAYDALGEITGKTATEDVVNAIFDRFCVGK